MTFNISAQAATADTLAAVTTTPVRGEPGAQKKIEGKSPWVLAWRRLRRDRAAMIALGVVAFIILLAVFAPVVAAITGHGNLAQFRGSSGATEGLDLSGQPIGPNQWFW